MDVDLLLLEETVTALLQSEAELRAEAAGGTKAAVSTRSEHGEAEKKSNTHASIVEYAGRSRRLKHCERRKDVS